MKTSRTFVDSSSYLLSPDAGHGEPEHHAAPGQVGLAGRGAAEEMHRVPRHRAAQLRAVGLLAGADGRHGREVFVYQTLVTSDVLVGESCTNKVIINLR